MQRQHAMAYITIFVVLFVMNGESRQILNAKISYVSLYVNIDDDVFEIP